MSLPRVAIFISGSGSNMERLVDDMLEGGYAHPAVVLSNDPQAGGLARARARGVDCAVVDHRPFKGDRSAFEARILEVLNEYAPDVLCLAGFMRILTAEFTSRFEGRMLNIHPSLLPKYKGLNTHQRALDAGDSHAGCTVHLVTAALDDGPILAQARVPIAADDTAQSLAARILPHEHRIYPEALRSFVAQLAER